MYERRVLELVLQRVALKVTGAGRGESRHLLAVRLVWPRPGTPEKTVLLPVSLDNGARDFAGLSWAERIVFKESVEGPFGLEVSVTEPLPNERLCELIGFFAESLFKAGGTEVAALLRGTPAASFVKAPFLYLGKEAASWLKQTPAVIAFARLDLSSDAAWPDGEERPLEVAFSAPEAVVRVAPGRGAGRPPRKVVLAAEGEANGAAAFAARMVR